MPKKVAVCSCTLCDNEILKSCPIVRMGKVIGTALMRYPHRNFSLHPNIVCVIPPHLCIGCGICKKICKHGKVSMLDW